MARDFRHGKSIAGRLARGKTARAALASRRLRAARLGHARLLRLEAREGGRFRRKRPLTALSLTGRKPGYDPELLYVECGRCGAPVLWEPGRATRILDEAGIDPLELDSACLLVTNACPMCGAPGDAGDGESGEAGYEVRVFRVGSEGFGPQRQGHA